jgi:hypothetical protein
MDDLKPWQHRLVALLLILLSLLGAILCLAACSQK